jgi:drug/metabolite transporter (DMT)-like permease
MKNETAKGHLSSFITILIWGTTFISTKILLADFAPVEILFCRFLLGWLALFIVCPKRLKVRDKKEELTYVFAGLCGICLYYLLENIALTYTMASNVGVIISAAPFFTAILSQLFMKGEERLKPNFFIGFLVAMVGICLISFNGAALAFNPIGDILAMIAALVWAVYSLLTRKISSYGYNTIQATRRIFTYGILFMLPALSFFEFHLEIGQFADVRYFLNFVFQGLGASALCFVTWNYAVKILGAVKTSVYYMVSVITIVTSAIVLHEKITAASVIGTVLTLAGLLISEGKMAWLKT